MTNSTLPESSSLRSKEITVFLSIEEAGLVRRTLQKLKYSISDLDAFVIKAMCKEADVIFSTHSFIHQDCQIAMKE